VKVAQYVPGVEESKVVVFLPTISTGYLSKETKKKQEEPLW
jgi:hypothetical protein